jgi:hypothetical protein
MMYFSPRFQALLLNAKMNSHSDDGHVPLSVLWDFSRNFNIEILTDADRHHMAVCERCIEIILLCQNSPSIKDVEERLKRP